jgi:hypothetical protein
MTISSILQASLTARILDALAVATDGHCLRVDDLGWDEAVSLCRDVRLRSSGAGAPDAFVLSSSRGGEEFAIPPERAVELRNLKEARLVLFVPSDESESTSSSLGNSFAKFNLGQALADAADELAGTLPSNVRSAVRAVHAVLRGSARPAVEDWADYLAAVASDPSHQRVGSELGRIGLIPDLGVEGLESRLADNFRCARALTRPARPQATISERIEATGIRAGEVARDIEAYLVGRRLHDWRAWLPDMVRAPSGRRITFEQWPIESTTPSDLESVELADFLDTQGQVQRWSGLVQPAGPGTQPEAVVGPKAKVSVRWATIPAKPSNVGGWSVFLVPAADDFADAADIDLELPEAKVSGPKRRAALALDLDLSGTRVRSVRARVRALDENGATIKGPDGNVLEGETEEFWLSDETLELDAGEPKARRETAPNLAIARLRAALDTKWTELNESNGHWTERDLHYYSTTLNTRRTISVAVSPVLRLIETLALAQPEIGFGAYSASVRPGSVLDPTADLKSVDIGALKSLPSVEAFASRRRDFFRGLQSQNARGLIEVSVWSDELCTRARSYARAYRELLKTLDGDSLKAALSVDTLRLRIQGDGTRRDSVLVLPTHPLRALWIAAYVELLRKWEAEALSQPGSRAGLVDLRLMERVVPANFPPFVMGEPDQPYLFAANLSFFWGLCLPVAADDPARHLAEVSHVIGLSAGDPPGDLPPGKVAEEIRAYIATHPYIRDLRINCINIGSGRLVADALRECFRPLLKPELDNAEFAADLPHVDVIAHTHAPVPRNLPALDQLEDDLYDAQPAGVPNPLNPRYRHAIRSISGVGDLPGGDVNLALALDLLKPRWEYRDDEPTGDSSSFFGLLMRLVGQFDAGFDGPTWTHGLALSGNPGRERHPGLGIYTTDIVETMREFVRGIGRLGGRGAIPILVSQLSDEDRSRSEAIHRSADWVVTVDRFFGPELFDDPMLPGRAPLARKYLLDYAPEFLEGFGHRMFVTTAQRGEIEEVLSRAMRDLGFGLVEESVGDVLGHLKAISGRLALRVIGDDARAREAVSLGVVAAYLRLRGELSDAILIPVDAHMELFGPVRPGLQGSGARCDLIAIRFKRGLIDATFIEVKSRSAASISDELVQRIADQVEATDQAFREHFFRPADPRLDRTLHRLRLASILSFYLGRASRHGMLSSKDVEKDLATAIARLEGSTPDLRTHHVGYVVNLSGAPQPQERVRETVIKFLTASDLVGTSFASAVSPTASSAAG